MILPISALLTPHSASGSKRFAPHKRAAASNMDLSAFYSQFREETAEHIRVLGDGLLALEGEADEGARRAAIDRVFRAMHTVKGSARMLGFEEVGRLAHALEHLLSDLRQGRRALDRPLADALLRGGDAVLALVAAAVEGRPAGFDVEAALAVLPAPAVEQAGNGAAARRSAPSPGADAPVAPAAPARAAPRQTVRVRVDRLDRMLDLAGELVVAQQALGHHGEQLRALPEQVEHQGRALAALQGGLGRLRFSATQRRGLDARLAALREAGESARRLAQGQGERFARQAAQHELLVRDLEQEVMAARLLPIATVYAGLPRTVRDLARDMGKEVRLELSGEAVELDRKVLELINDPLMHLVRNAVDHGVEPPAEREAAGKAPQGVIAVGAEAAGGEVRVTIQDDGRGIDPRALRERAVRLGLLSPEAAALLSDDEALELVFQPGFSTAAMVTEISGRGVGMDVVRANLGELGGQVRVQSRPGRGTRIVLALPLTLVTTRVLLVRAGRATFALPAAGCNGTRWVRRDELRGLEGQPTLEVEGRTVVALPLAELLGLASPSPLDGSERAPAVLIGGAQRPLALLVDALVDEREAVVKPLGPLLAAQRTYAGAVQLGNGGLVLLLNPAHLGGATRVAAPARSQAPRRRPRLLVADDSFTTRELIRSILQSAGYEVTAAVDGADALARLRAAPYDLLVSDVEMPRLDGLELVARLRGEPALRQLPAVLVTSLASEEQRRRGLEAGAQAYIVKSQFDQESLLDVIRQLLGAEQ